jgi:hypothetical protein
MMTDSAVIERAEAVVIGTVIRMNDRSNVLKRPSTVWTVLIEQVLKSSEAQVEEYIDIAVPGSLNCVPLAVVVLHLCTSVSSPSLMLKSKRSIPYSFQVEKARMVWNCVWWECLDFYQAIERYFS